MRLSVAAGETEGFQLVVRNLSHEELKGIRVSVSGLSNVRASIYAAGSVKVENPGRSTNAAPGRYFDLLRPAGWESITAGEFRPYWIDLKVPVRGVNPGVVCNMVPGTGKFSNV